MVVKEATLTLNIDPRKGIEGQRRFSRATKDIENDTRRADRELRTVNRTMSDTGSVGAKAARQIGSLVAGLAAFSTIRRATALIGEFQETMAVAGGVTRASADEMERLTATARIMGATTRFSATQAGQGLVFLARAGFNVDQAVGALPATLNLAQVGLLDLGTAADLASNVMSQFGLVSKDTDEIIANTSRTVDALVIVANRANTDIAQLGEAMKFVGPVASGAGVSLEETASAIGVLGDNGIQASLAGTSLRGIILDLINPTTKAQGALLAMGLSLEDVNPLTVGLTKAFENLGAAGLGAENVSEVFNKRTAASALVLSRSTERMKELQEATIAESGEADRLARTMDNTLKASVLNFNSAVQELVLNMGDRGLAAVLRSTIDFATQVARELSGIEVEGEKASVSVKATAFAVESLTSAAAAYVAIGVVQSLIDIAREARTAREVFDIFGVSGLRAISNAGKFGTLLGRLAGALAGPAGLAIALGLTTTAVFTLTDYFDQGRDSVNRYRDSVLDLEGSITRLAQIAAEEEVFRTLGGDGTSVSPSNIEQRIRSYNAALREVIAGQTTAGDASTVPVRQAAQLIGQDDVGSIRQVLILQLEEQLRDALRQGLDTKEIGTVFSQLFSKEIGGKFFNTLGTPVLQGNDVLFRRRIASAGAAGAASDQFKFETLREAIGNAPLQRVPASLLEPELVSEIAQLEETLREAIASGNVRTRDADGTLTPEFASLQAELEKFRQLQEGGFDDLPDGADNGSLRSLIEFLVDLWNNRNNSGGIGFQNQQVAVDLARQQQELRFAGLNRRTQVAGAVFARQGSREQAELAVALSDTAVNLERAAEALQASSDGLASVPEQLIFENAQLGDVLRTTLVDVSRSIFSNLITEPLSDAISDSLSASFGSLFGVATDSLVDTVGLEASFTSHIVGMQAAFQAHVAALASTLGVGSAATAAGSATAAGAAGAGLLAGPAGLLLLGGLVVAGSQSNALQASPGTESGGPVPKPGVVGAQGGYTTNINISGVTSGRGMRRSSQMLARRVSNRLGTR